MTTPNLYLHMNLVFSLNLVNWMDLALCALATCMLIFIVLHQALLCQKPTVITTNHIWTDDWYSEAKRFKFKLKGIKCASKQLHHLR